MNTRPKKANPPYILVVDKDHRVVEVLASILGNMQHHVSSADSWEDALKLIEREGKPLLVIASAGLPDITGPKLIQAVKEFEAVPLILIFGGGDPLTGYGDDCQPAITLYKPLVAWKITEAVIECLSEASSE